MMATPRCPRTTRPFLMSVSTTGASRCGTAKPRPEENVEVTMSVLMPITLPSRESSGPPLLPGLIAASVWM